MPTKKLWRDFPRLKVYQKFTEYIRTGNIKEYRNNIKHLLAGRRTLATGTLFALERCQALVYRRIFKKV